MAETDFSMDTPVLVIVEVLAILDAGVMAEYVGAIASQMARYNARNIGAGLKTYKGPSDAINMVVSQWPSARAYLDWQASNEYAPWREKREAAADIRTHFVSMIE